MTPCVQAVCPRAGTAPRGVTHALRQQPGSLIRCRPRRGRLVACASADPTAVSPHVTEVTSEAQFDAVLASAGDKLVVVDCSATWCGPCKLFKPTFVQFAEAYNSQASFVSVVGDLNASTATLMKRLQVKSVPAFFFFKQGKEVSSFTGANKQGFRNNLAQFIQI